MSDFQFDNMKLNGDTWSGIFEFKKPISGTDFLIVNLRNLNKDSVYNCQRLLQNLDIKYDGLWGEISSCLLTLCSHATDIKCLASALTSTISIAIPGRIGGKWVDFTLIYEYKNDNNKGIGYFISFIDWKIDSFIEAA